MTARLAALSPRAIAVIALVVVALYAAVVWLLVVAPKRAEVSRVADEVAAAETRLAAAQAAAGRAYEAPLSVADVLKLSKAMPTSADQASLVLELSSLATKSGVLLRSIAPEEPVVEVGEPTAIPVTVSVSGTYFKIARFLALARSLASLRGDQITARGRLLAVQSVELRESQTKRFPHLDGVVTLRAYVYDGPITPPTPPPASPTDGSEPIESSAAGSTS